MLYLFNPDHDLALANGDENFHPPRLAKSFAIDLGYLPVWFAEKGSVVLTSRPDWAWFENLRNLFPPLETVSLCSPGSIPPVDGLAPWGWNRAIRKFFLSQEIDAALLPDTIQIENIRRLSHRRTSVLAMQFLRETCGLSEHLPQPAVLLQADEVGKYASEQAQVVFKAPWSGSGKGLFWAKGSLTPNAIGWCRNIAEKQDGVLGEPVYNKIIDFAMEFFCSQGEVVFSGYSLFETDARGAYQGSVLAGDPDIFKKLALYVSPQLLQSVREGLLSFFQKEIAPFYLGYLGVDMMVYRKEEAFALHPCVEINLRMTMGMVARLFFDRFVQPGKSGNFNVDYDRGRDHLLADHVERKKLKPLLVRNGLIESGYLSLSPIDQQSHYRVRIEIND